MLDVSIKIDWEIPPDLIGVYSRSSSDPFVGEKDGPYDFGKAHNELLRYADTKKYGKYERLGIMKIYFKDIVIGFAFPRILHSHEYHNYTLFEDNREGAKEWYRLGTCYLDESFRGHGIMQQAIAKFRELYPNVVWSCLESNLSSRKTATLAGLEYMTTDRSGGVSRVYYRTT